MQRYTNKGAIDEGGSLSMRAFGYSVKVLNKWQVVKLENQSQAVHRVGRSPLGMEIQDRLDRLSKAVPLSVHGVQNCGASSGDEGEWDWQPGGRAIPDDVPRSTRG